MKAKNKAKELIVLFNVEIQLNELTETTATAKKCALIAVEELLTYISNIDELKGSMKSADYWQEVKKEIIKLK